MTGLPCFDELLLVGLELAVYEEVLARPARALLRGAVVVPDGPLDPTGTDLDPTQLAYKGTSIQLRDHTGRGLLHFVIDRQGVALELFAKFVDPLFNGEHRDRV